MTPTAQFLDALYADYGDREDLRIEVRALRPKSFAGRGRGPRVARRWYPLSFADTAAKAGVSERAAGHWDIYQSVLPRIGEKGDTASIPLCAWLWCDVDAGEEGFEATQARLDEALIPPPHVTIRSGTGLHCYFRLAYPVPLETDEQRQTLRSTLRRLCYAIGWDGPGAHADKARADIASVLRMPGTLNHKYDPPLPVTLLRFEPDAPRMSYLDWRDGLPAIPLPPPHPVRLRTPLTGGRGNYPDTPEFEAKRRAGALAYIQHHAASEMQPGRRHETMKNSAAWLIRDVAVPPGDVEKLLEDLAGHSEGEPIPRYEIQNIVRWAAQRG